MKLSRTTSRELTGLCIRSVRTARTDIELIRKRLNAAKDDYEERYGKEAD